MGEQIAEVYRFHRGMGKAEARQAAGAMLETVQISDPSRVLGRYPHELSGGQQQRIMFAMALATDPELLVLDEPTTGLDATVEAEVLDLVEQLRDQFNTAILFVTHNLGIVARVCERVGVLYAGRLIEQGQARELFNDPRHPYSLALLRCAPRLGMSKQADRLDPIPGSLPPLGARWPDASTPTAARSRATAAGRGPPPLVPVAGGAHASRCFFPDEVPGIPRRESVEAAARAPGTEMLLDVEHLVKAYKFSGTEVVAVAGVDLELHAGEVLGLVGESGSGKSSLAKCVVGLIAPTRGHHAVRGRGHPGARRSAAARRCAAACRWCSRIRTARSTRATRVRGILRRSLRLLAGVTGREQQEHDLGDLAQSVRLEPRHLDLRPARAVRRAQAARRHRPAVRGQARRWCSATSRRRRSTCRCRRRS